MFSSMFLRSDLFFEADELGLDRKRRGVPNEFHVQKDQSPLQAGYGSGSA